MEQRQEELDLLARTADLADRVSQLLREIARLAQPPARPYVMRGKSDEGSDE